MSRRTFARRVAHKKMERAGIHKPNSFDFFARHWREWANKPILKPRTREPRGRTKTA